MDNTIRTALEQWLPLIKGLSFDERVGFLLALTACDNPSRHIRYSQDELLVIRNGIYKDLTEIQTEQLRQARIDYSSRLSLIAIGPGTEIKPPTATPEQLKRGLALAIEREDWASVSRISKKLEREKG